MAQPNILLFMTDQQRGDSLPIFGRARMPVLEQFCAEGVTFTQAHCPAPHCCPSRATFWSGLYPSQHGVWNNVDVGNALARGPYPGTRIFSDDLREAGYRLEFSGKWHISATEMPPDRGWEMTFPAPRPTVSAEEMAGGRPHTREWALYEALAGRPETAERAEAQILRPGWGDYSHYGVSDAHFGNFDRLVLDDALERIHRRRPGEGPWCQFVGTLGPHDPYYVPARFLELYPEDEIELPASFGDRMDDKPGLYRRTRGRFDQLSEQEQRRALRHYLAFCSYQDELFGEVLEALRQTGQLDDTLVVFVSDHGDYAGEHGLWCKGLPCFKGAYHVPAAIRWPGRIANPGRCVDRFVSLADFAPTLLEAAGVEPQKPHAGQSLLPFLRDEEPATWRDALFTQTNGNELYGIQRSVTTAQWKYVYNGFDEDELYDLTRDPGEVTNLAKDPAYDPIIRELCGRLWSFARAHDDVCINPYIMVALAPYGPGVGVGG